MITTISQARQRKYPEDIGKGNGNCQTTNCMAWEFYVPPPGISIEKRCEHGLRDCEKKGYCGKSTRRS